MTLSLDNFRIDYPEFDDDPDEQVQRSLDRAALRLDEDKWGNLYDEAQGLIAAHLLQTSKAAQAGRFGGMTIAGPISSVNIPGEYSVSFSGSGGSSSNSSSEYSKTSYGAQYLQLQSQAIVGITWI